MDINLELYKVFYTVAKNKSMTKAAKELNISQPAISKSIKNLENQLNGTLFLRTNTKLELTEEGKMFYDKIGIALNFINNAENEFCKFSNLEKGEINIGISSVLTKIILLDTLKNFKKLYPNININIENGLTSNSVKLLNDGKLDFMIYNESNILEKNLNNEKLLDLNYCFVYNPNFYNIDNLKKLKELNNYPIILQNKESNTRKFLDNYLKNNNINLEVSYNIVSQDLICEFCDNGLGIGFVLESLIDKKFKTLSKIFILNDFKTNVFLATNKNLNLTFASKKFIEILKKNIKENYNNE